MGRVKEGTQNLSAQQTNTHEPHTQKTHDTPTAPKQDSQNLELDSLTPPLESNAPKAAQKTSQKATPKPKTTLNEEKPTKADNTRDSKQLSKEASVREPKEQAAKKPTEQTPATQAMAQATQESSAHTPQEISPDETLPPPTTPKEHTKNTHEPSAPKAQKQDKQDAPQKPQAHIAKHAAAPQGESASSGDSKQQCSHTPLDSQKPQANQSVQMANEEFAQDLEQSARAIEHIQKSSESKPTKQAPQANHTPKDAPQAPTASAQAIKPEVLYRSVAARESVRNFASQLSQEVLNYKPPITKLSLELNPQNLGALELTISKKGKDLQVQVVSNPTAINLFVNNQAELRANLAQMGFSNVDLSFSQNGANSGQKHQQGRRNQRQAYQASEGNENGLESHTMVITIPQYA